MQSNREDPGTLNVRATVGVQFTSYIVAPPLKGFEDLKCSPKQAVIGVLFQPADSKLFKKQQGFPRTQ